MSSTSIYDLQLLLSLANDEGLSDQFAQKIKIGDIRYLPSQRPNNINFTVFVIRVELTLNLLGMKVTLFGEGPNKESAHRLAVKRLKLFFYQTSVLAKELLLTEEKNPILVES